MSNQISIADVLFNNEAKDQLIKPRLTIVLHPNTSCISIVLNDRKFNNEKYYHTRDKEAVGTEKELLDYCNNAIIGITKASAGKNVLHLDICDGMLLREIIPSVVIAVKRWGSVVESYNPEIYLENRRYEIAPEYHDEDGWMIREGVREQPDKPNIGMAYQVWHDGR